ncbi:MAG: hypothetical protein LBD57_04500 [Endomicrobium sp.]|jgi:hypothetical protein|uniref:hypothetical protein n=1 Tax=Candidatus Endomicrobiellum cubanum TaxID=3242325 RepID=UPI00282A0308|nr:hypothetical protein [Endomicrobium sp.]
MDNGVQRNQMPFNGNFYDHEGKIRNIDSLSGGGGSASFPPGGKPGEFLGKVSVTDNDVAWLDPLAGLPDNPYRGEYADLAALQSAYPTDVQGAYATITGQLYIYNNGWQLASGAYRGKYTTLLELQTAYPTDIAGSLALVGDDLYVYDNGWIIGSQGTPAVTGIPNGGTTGQVLAKASNTDVDVEWIDFPIVNDAFVWHGAYHVITATDVANKYFDITEEIEASLKQDTILFVETDVQSRDDYEVISPSRISWSGKGLETDPPMQAGWTVWVLYPVKVSGLGVGGGTGGTGADGKSAYELAVEEGYSGTLQQWLLSLKAAGKRYLHTQTSPEKTWNVQHNFNEKPVAVVTRDSTGEEVVCYHDWSTSTQNLLVLKFNMPLAGSALVLG